MHVPANPPEAFCCVDAENLTYKIHATDPTTGLVYCSTHLPLAHLDDICREHFVKGCGACFGVRRDYTDVPGTGETCVRAE